MNRSWYLVYSKPKKEQLAELNLRAKGIEVFFPRISYPDSGGKIPHIAPLFPNYLFAKFHLPAHYNQVIWAPGVRRLVSFGESPYPIDDKLVEFFLEKTDATGTIAALSTLRAGQNVSINRGPFSGLVGIIQDPPNAKQRVRILLDILARQVSVEMPVRFVHSGWTIHPTC